MLVVTMWWMLCGVSCVVATVGPGPRRLPEEREDVRRVTDAAVLQELHTITDLLTRMQTTGEVFYTDILSQQRG